MVNKAYDLLANGNVPEHMQALQMLEQARTLDYETVLQFEREVAQHKMLSIVATDPNTIIYLIDMENNLVQQEIGIMQTSVLPGIYQVQFGINGDLLQINLDKDMEINQ